MIWPGAQSHTQSKELHKRIAKGNTYAVRLDNTLVATLLLLWEDGMM